MLKRIALPTLGVLLVLSMLATGTVFASAESVKQQAGVAILLEDSTEFPDWFAIAAEKLKLDDDALWEALVSGKTIAQLAQDRNVNSQVITNAIVAAEKDFIKKLVSDKEITQEEADEWLSHLQEDVQYFIEESFKFDEAAWEETSADFVEGPDWFAITAEKLKLSVDALWKATETGKSIVQVAQEHGVDSQVITNAIVAAEKDFINKLVSDKEIAQEEADEWLSYLQEDVQYFIEESFNIYESEIEGDCDLEGLDLELLEEIVE